MSRALVEAWVGLGANLGEPREQIQHALAQLRLLHHGPSQSWAVSRMYASAPVSAVGPDYVNAVAQLSTELTAPDLLRALQHIEQQLGRLRPYANAPRTMDLDLLFYGDAQVQSPALTVPHPRWADRAFVLRPLQDICPQRVSAERLQLVANQGIRLLE